MFSINSRKLLCFLLTLLITLGSVIAIFSLVTRATICNQLYVEKFICSGDVRAYCDNVYNQRIAILSDNSGIPVQVFEVSKDNGGYDNSVVKRFFDGSDTTVFTQDKINTFEKMIKEYLDGNEYSYDDEAIHNTAVKAAQIYSECYGLKDVGDYKTLIDTLTSLFNKTTSAGLCMAVIGFVLISIMHTEKRKALKYYLSSFVSSGLTLVLASALSIIFGVSKLAQITPVIYQTALRDAVTTLLLICIVIGVLFILVSQVLLLRQYKLTKKTRNG